MKEKINVFEALSNFESLGWSLVDEKQIYQEELDVLKIEVEGSALVKQKSVDVGTFKTLVSYDYLTNEEIMNGYNAYRNKDNHLNIKDIELLKRWLKNGQ